MRDSWCANCGHPPHDDPTQNDFCYRVTPDGLCGCESWSEKWPCDDCGQEPCECQKGDDMDLTSDPLPVVKEVGTNG